MSLTAVLSIAWPLLAPIARPAVRALLACGPPLRRIVYLGAAVAAAAVAWGAVRDWRAASGYGGQPFTAGAASEPLTFPPLASFLWVAPAAPCLPLSLRWLKHALRPRRDRGGGWSTLLMQQGLLLCVAASVSCAAAARACSRTPAVALPALTAPFHRLWGAIFTIRRQSDGGEATHRALDGGHGVMESSRCRHGCVAVFSVLTSLMGWATVALLAQLTGLSLLNALAAGVGARRSIVLCGMVVRRSRERERSAKECYTITTRCSHAAQYVDARTFQSHCCEQPPGTPHVLSGKSLHA